MLDKIKKSDIKIYRERLKNNKCKCKLNGYEIVFCPEHPNSYKKGHLYKHRLIKEIELGKYLETDDVVHHKNKNRISNGNKNLKVLNRGQHNNRHKVTEFWKLICPWCKSEFIKEKRLVERNWRRNCSGPFCSKTCSSYARENSSKKVISQIVDKFQKRKKSKFYA